MQPGTQACEMNLFRPNAFGAHESIAGSVGEAGSDLSSIAGSNIPLPDPRAARSSNSLHPRSSVAPSRQSLESMT